MKINEQQQHHPNDEITSSAVAALSSDNNNNNEEGSSESSSSSSNDYDSTTTTSTSTPSQNVATIRQVLSFARTRRTRFLIAGSFCFAVITGAVFPAMAFYYSHVLKALSASTTDTGEGFLDAIRGITYAFMIIGCIVFVSMTCQVGLSETAAIQMTNTMKTCWFEALLRQDMAYYDILDVAGRATIISTNGIKFQKGVGQKLSEAAQFTVTFVGALGYAFYASWKVTLAILVVSPLLMLSAKFLIKMTSTQTLRGNKAYEKAGGIATTAVSSIRTVLALNAVTKMINLYERATAMACNDAIHNSWRHGLAYGCLWSSYLMTYVVVALFGSFLLYSQVLDTGCDPSGTVDDVSTCDPNGADIFGSLIGVAFAAMVLPQVSLSIEAFSDARAACYPAIAAMNRKLDENNNANDNQNQNEEMKDIGDKDKDRDVEVGIDANNSSQNNKNGISSNSNGRHKHHHHHRCHDRNELALPKYEIDSSSVFGSKLMKVSGGIEFVDVSFCFPARPSTQVLKRFSLNVPAGTTVALVGASGSGKSTVVQLIERFYDPTSGQVKLDGIDLRDLNVRWLREQLGLVLQEPKLFDKSIRENISLGDPNVSQEQIEDAARIANAHDFIMSFPNQYNTQVGDLGSQLSGGQRQRISIARVVCRNPRIFVFDEATSALDSESEKIVQEALEKLMKLEGSTTLVIAHRLSTIKNADVIAVVKDGAIVESGSHAELLGRRGEYFALVEAQKGKGKTPTEKIDEEKPELTPEESGNLDDSQRQSVVIDPSALVDDSSPPVIRFRDVHFRYPTRTEVDVFRGLNLSVLPGETLGLVGQSGCGKSTVIQLIECFYHPTQGIVEYHGVDMRDINVRWLRDQLGLVSQEAILFPTSIEENIRYGYQEATMDQIVDAAKQANCHDFICSFPDQYQTAIGEGGSLVSGGQKQRICLARAILKKPSCLLLDEATSSLDSENERVVQAALEKIMSDRNQTVVVIAHRLSTIRNADRIAVIDNGKVREIGSHDELMSKPDGRYRRLQELQNLDVQVAEKRGDVRKKGKLFTEVRDGVAGSKGDRAEQNLQVTDIEAKRNRRRAWVLGYDDKYYILVGIVGALIAGFYYPAFGFVFAYMIELLYYPVQPCPPTYGFADCPEYHESVAAGMQQRSLTLFYAFMGLAAATLLGDMILFWGFGSASERMNKRVRDSAFNSLLRQEVAWFDVRSPGDIVSQLAVDAALLHAYSGEPVRTAALTIASLVLGVIISFVFMWQFALLAFACIPFLAFGSTMKWKMVMSDDKGSMDDTGENSPGGIVIETLSNMRTVASLTLESKRANDYKVALAAQNPRPLVHNLVHGATFGLGQFVLMWTFGLLMWWGGWLLQTFPTVYTFRDFLISMFSLTFSMRGLSLIKQGTVDKDQAKAAAARIFELTDRKSQIDPLGESGKKDI